VSSAGREGTRAARQRAVERVVAVLRERFADPLSLGDMADIAISSPFHFNRIFRQVTGVPPGRFLSAVRLQAAKQLLLTTRRSVTDICFAVGYNSLGTFTTHFTMLVGASPKRFRKMHGGPVDVELPRRLMERQQRAPIAAGALLIGDVSAVDGFIGPVMVGVFRTPIPRGRPVACSMVQAPGRYRMHGLPDGSHYVLGVALDTTSDALGATRLTGELLRRGRAGPINVRSGFAAGPSDVVLREPKVTDPPILIALDVLMTSHAENC
jgi:AraC-like DNA-binding protein